MDIEKEFREKAIRLGFIPPQKFTCFSCNKHFMKSEVLEKKMPANFRVGHLPDGAVLPKCPHCGAVAFFGFCEV